MSGRTLAILAAAVLALAVVVAVDRAGEGPQVKDSIVAELPPDAGLADAASREPAGHVAEPEEVRPAGTVILSFDPWRLEAIHVDGRIHERGTTVDEWRPGDPAALGRLRDAAAELRADETLPEGPFRATRHLRFLLGPAPGGSDPRPTDLTLDVAAPDKDGRCLARSPATPTLFRLPAARCAALLGRP